MTVFEIHPTSKADGSFAATWFDDETCLWNDNRLSLAAPIGEAWVPPSLKLHCPVKGATTVLFNPNALVVSCALKDALASFVELEFLPVGIEGHGEFHIMRAVATVDLPAGSRAHIAPQPSGNLVQIEAFPRSFESEHAFFRVLHPPGSAAGKAGMAMRKLYANVAGAHAIERYALDFLTVTRVPSI
jgi:hypothetical protein